MRTQRCGIGRSGARTRDGGTHPRVLSAEDWSGRPRPGHGAEDGTEWTPAPGRERAFPCPLGSESHSSLEHQCCASGRLLTFTTRGEES